MHDLSPWTGHPHLPGPATSDLRRRRHPSPGPGAESTASASGASTCCLQTTGCRGELRLRLQRHAGGLYVEREEIPRHGPRTVQALLFHDAGQFAAWCDDDPLRFEHPLLHLRLQREAAALWHAHGGDHDAG